MHELSLCSAIATSVDEHAGGRTVTSVRLRIGHFRQVVPDTLAFCWGLHTDGGPLAGSTLEIEEVPAVITCATCGAVTTLVHPILVCGSCGGRDVALTSGEEFLIDSIEVAGPTRPDAVTPERDPPTRDQSEEIH